MPQVFFLGAAYLGMAALMLFVMALASKRSIKNRRYFMRVAICTAFLAIVIGCACSF